LYSPYQTGSNVIPPNPTQVVHWIDNQTTASFTSSIFLTCSQLSGSLRTRLFRSLTPHKESNLKTSILQRCCLEAKEAK